MEDSFARKELERLRGSIDNLHAPLVHLLAERFKCTQEVGRLKAQYRLPPADPEREARQIQRPHVQGRQRHVPAVGRHRPGFIADTSACFPMSARGRGMAISLQSGASSVATRHVGARGSFEQVADVTFARPGMRHIPPSEPVLRFGRSSGRCGRGSGRRSWST
ncbi:chorismate mutase [Nonomuraea sp. NPDC003707]